MDKFRTYTLKDEQKEEKISLIKSELGKRADIIFAYVYGSFIEPEAYYFRDIDIGIYVNKDIISANQFFDYALNLALELESFLDKYPVDVIVMNDAPLTILFKITQGRLLFTRNEDLWTDFVVKTWSLYHEHVITSRGLLDLIIKS